MGLVFLRIAFALLCLCGLSADAFARRVALVIGNANYAAVSPLKNPINDARGVAGSLQNLGFEVIAAFDLDKANFEARIRDFAQALHGAEAAVFYYAGHGLRVDGRNYMIPVDAKINNEADLPFELVAIDIVLHRIAHHRITNIVILDACRDNPLTEKLSQRLGERSNAVGPGLASIYAAVGTLISYSTQPGNTALDGEDGNSPYSGALIRHIGVPGVDVVDIFKRVRRDVVTKTNSQQVPWDTSSLVDPFFFRNSEKGGASPADERKKSGDDGNVVRNGKPPLHPCDTIAASATDPERVTEGHSFRDLDGVAGVKACRAALATYPNTPRFEFQLARSLQKVEAHGEAAALYRRLVERGYFAALTNYGFMLNAGHGVAKDPNAAVKLFLLAAHQGDKFGMFNTAMAYDSGSGLPRNPAQAAAWIYAALRLGHDYTVRQLSGPYAQGWTRDFRVELQRLLRRAGAYFGPADGSFGSEMARAMQALHTLPLAPMPGGDTPDKRFDPTTLPVNAPPPR